MSDSESIRKSQGKAGPTDGTGPAGTPGGPDDSAYPPALSDEERMLLKLRDELYEGRWDLFITDLEARFAGKPHLFEIGSASSRLKERITGHLDLIRSLQATEERLGIDLAQTVGPHPFVLTPQPPHE